MPSEELPAHAVPAAEFDLRDFARTAAGSHRADLELDVYATNPLSGPVLDLLDYLADVERATLTYLRGVLVTPTHQDARVTAFLVTWAYEKYWIADALERIVQFHGVRPLPQRSGTLRRIARSWSERVEPIRESVVANAIGDDVIAVHTMTGAVDEWITEAAYSRLADAAGHPELARAIDGILAVKRRHLEFFAAQSRDRLSGSPRAVRLARRRLPRTTWPLGSDGQPRWRNAQFYAALIDDQTLRRIDATVDSFPGLGGLLLVRRSMARSRAGRRS